MPLPFEVTRKFGHNAAKIIATFSDKKDAQLYTQDKAAYDHTVKVDSTYTLTDHDEDKVILTIESKQYASSNQATDSADTGSGFNPNPFATTAKPAGYQSAFTNTKKDSNDEDL